MSVPERAAAALFGLRLDSELPLPELPPAEGSGERVSIRFAPVPVPPQPVAADGADLTLDVPEVGRFRIRGAREILIEPAPGASERNLRVYLYGSAMGALLHQRGLLPLHANAVGLGGRAVAFAGRSGAGKSTLADWFARRGEAVLCDDVCAIAPDEAGAPLVLPGIPRLRLWADAIERTGRDAAAFERSFDGQDKFDVPVGATAAGASGPRPLAACYILSEAEGEGGGATDPPIVRLSGVDAVEALVANTYRGRFAQLMGMSERHLRLCLAVVRKVPVFRAERRWGKHSFEAEAERLAAHAAAII